MEDKPQPTQDLNDTETIRLIVDKSFHQTDLDKNGSINEAELGNMLRDCAKELRIPPPDQKEIHAVFEELDINKDQKLSKEEFKVLVVKLIDYCKKFSNK